MGKTGLLFLALACGAAQTPELTSEQVVALARTFFRDTGELPMNVRVTKVVTDAGGKLKRRSESTVRVVYRGYNNHRFNSGWFNTGSLRDSMSGDLALGVAMLVLAPKNGDPVKFKIVPPSAAGQPYQVVLELTGACPPLQFARNSLLPVTRFCASCRYSLAGAPPSGLVFENFRLDVANLPAPAKLADLGDVEIRGVRVEGDFQKAFLPGDAQPYLLPRQVVISMDTSKGSIQVTNQYSPRAAK
jgi:hypothetical protein